MRSSDIWSESTKFDSPIDVMYLIHKAFRTEAVRVVEISEQLEIGGSFQPFRAAFDFWASVLAYHAEQEDNYMTPSLADFKEARDNEEGHRRLEERLEAVLTCLNEEIGRTSLVYRTKRHLTGNTIMLRIAQNDHLEEEEAFVLPLVRERMTELEQVQFAKRLLIDEDSEDPRWIIDWMARVLTPNECNLLTSLEARFTELPS